MMDCVGFLKAFHPNGPWVLTSIQPTRKGIEVKSFGPDAEDETKKWIEARNGKQNIYFHVNTPKAHTNKKTSREDIARVDWLHVDIDARVQDKDDKKSPQEYLAQELSRIRRLIDEDCPVPPPTFIVFSGGGYQAFWKLNEPIEVNGNIAIADEIARYNKQLEIILGGDNCHNIDRIMRLPGTMNLPNTQKTKKGRIPILSEVYSYAPKNVYSLSQFTQAQPLQSQEDVSNTVDVNTSNIERIDNVDYLDKWEVPDRVKVVLVQGMDHDNPKKDDNSRSAWLFDAICQLVRCRVPDDIIFSIITDPSYDISSSVIDKGSNASKYAMRQIQRAKDEAINPWLRKLNDRFFVVGNLGGKCRVVEVVLDPHLGRVQHTRQTFQDFRNRWLSHTVQVGKKKTVSAGHWWLMHKEKRQFDYMVFYPGRTPPGAYNLWQGFSCESIPGDKHEPYLEHVKNNICNGNTGYYDYLISWMARTVQYPAKPGETAVVLRGKSGTGKSFFAKQFGSLLGHHFVQVSDAKHLVGAFNAHLRDCVVLFGDEAFFAGDRKHESVLKTIITEERLMIEQKGIDVESSPNFVHLILASNSEWVVPTGATERRFFVLDVNDSHMQNVQYFQAISKAMSDGGRENLLYFLLNHDISNFEVRNVPMTEALMDQKLHSMDSMSEWWYTRLQTGNLIESHNEWEGIVSVSALMDDYVQHCRRWNVLRMGNQVKLGQFIRKMSPDGWPKRGRASVGQERYYTYQFPSLDVMRKHLEMVYGGAPITWEKSEMDHKMLELPY
jgi:hypothetical protein